jgi:hypothetical protein
VISLGNTSLVYIDCIDPKGSRTVLKLLKTEVIKCRIEILSNLEIASIKYYCLLGMLVSPEVRECFIRSFSIFPCTVRQYKARP